MTTPTITRADGFSYDLVAGEPRLVVEPGERFKVETEDAFNGALRTEHDLPDASSFGDQLARDEFGPCAGPIVVTGARAGDVLAIDIHAIDLAEQGVTCVFEGCGPLQDSATYPDCRGPFTKVIPQSGGVGTYAGRSFTLDPHIGTIATAPARGLSAGADTNYGQGRWGGNIDCRDICPGHRLLLPVEVDGAHLYLGDVHGGMADGELFGVGIESRATVTLSCEILPPAPLPAPRIITPDRIVQLCSIRPLDDAVAQAFRWMLAWLVEEYGFTARDAYVLLGIHPEVCIHVYQAIRLGRLGCTVGVSFPTNALQAA